MPESGAHVLVFPYPAHGHMIPLLNFTRHLATSGLTITILVTPKNLPFIQPLLAAHPDSITPLVLPFPEHPDIPSGVQNTVDLPANAFAAMMRALSDLRSPIAHWFRSHPSPPVAIISDLFLGWAHYLACQLSIRHFAFFPTGAFTVSFYDFLWREMPGGEMVGSTEIPNSPVYPWWQVSPVYRSYVEGGPYSEFIRDTMMANWASHGLVLNTFDGLERIHLDYLCRKLGHDRIWAIGPVLPPDDVGSSSDLAREICSWLDTCQDHTVVYVCFGSQVVLTNTQMKKLTLGLEKSGVKFILSVKGATKGHNEGDYASIPLGFEDRVNGRGLVIKGWAPQVPILNHKAICATLSHCGWNSMLESIVAGVPMLAWPMWADNFLNATLIVDQLHIGIRVCEGAETVPDSDKLIKCLGETRSEKWSDMRARIIKLGKVALDATNSGGSSFESLNDIALYISKNY